jgi:hypothetical protein
VASNQEWQKRERQSKNADRNIFAYKQEVLVAM